MARGPMARQVFQEVLSKLDGVASRRPTLAEVASIRLNRFEQRWSRTLAIAVLLAEGRFIDPTIAGRSDAFGMLFPLHHLFERAMRGVLSRAAKPLGLTVEHQARSLHMLRDHQGVGHLQVRPDFLFSLGDRRLLIGDAKWKRLTNAQRASGVDRDDVFQMNAYLTRFEVERGVIFVPKVSWMGREWRHDFTIPPGARQLSLLAVDIQGVLSRVPATNDAALKGLRQSVGELAGFPPFIGPPRMTDLLNSAGVEVS